MHKEAMKNNYQAVLFGMIAGGALSNLYDRIAYGFVVDYIDIRVWPVFNLSDMCISIAITLYVIHEIRHLSQKHHRQ
jgi:signal peptidase II